MAPLFPPKHKSLASPIDDLKILSLHATLTITVTVYGLCPANAQELNVFPTLQTIQAVQQADDPTGENHEPRTYRVVAVGAFGSTSSSDLNVDVHEDVRLQDDDLSSVSSTHPALIST